MSRTKLKRFAEIKTFPNVFRNEVSLRGAWRQKYFENQNPITLELGCGWGEYTIHLAQSFPQQNFVGVDIKGERLWKGAKFALENNLSNVAFIRNYAEELTDFFAQDEVDEIWIPFPDPRPKKSDAKKRLISPRLLSLYRQVIKREGLIHLKTDDTAFFDFTLDVLEAENCKLHQVVEDLHEANLERSLLTLKTKYERKHLAQGKGIKYICFSFA